MSWIYQKFSNFFCGIDDSIIGKNKLTGFGSIQLQDSELCLGVVRPDQVITLIKKMYARKELQWAIFWNRDQEM